MGTMFDRARRTPDTIPLRQTHEAEPLTRYEERYLKRSRILRRLASACISTTAFLGATTLPLYSLYMNDVRENEAREAQVEVSLQTIQEPIDASSTFFFDGFNTLDAHYLTQKLGPAVQQATEGGLESVNSGDAPPNTKEIATQIIKYSEDHDLEHISLFGYSLGGIEAMKVATLILQNSGLQIDTIYLGSSPYNLDSLRPEKTSQYNMLTSAVAAVPDSEHSSYAKFLLNLVFQADNFAPGDNIADRVSHFNAEAFSSSWDSAMDAVNDKQRPSISTLEYQLDLAKANLNDEFQKIADLKDTKALPSIVYLKLQNDNTVNNDEAFDAYQAAANKNGLLITSLTIQGSQHAEYYTDSSVAGYTEAIKDNKEVIQSQVVAQEQSYKILQWEARAKNQNDALSFNGITPSNQVGQ